MSLPSPFKVSAEGFVILPCALIDEVPDSSFLLVYMALYRRGHGSADGCWCSQQRLSQDSGVYLKGVRKALQWLEEAGWIQGQHRQGDTSIYRVITQKPVTNDRKPEVTPVENDLGGRSKTTQGGGSKTTGGGRSKTTYKQNPSKQNPSKPNPIERATADAEAPVTGSKRKVRFAPKPDDVPIHLQPVAAELLTFFAEKGGSNSQRAWNCLLTELEKIQTAPDGGIQVVRDLLAAGTQAGWTSIRHSQWERFKRPARSSTYAEPRGCRPSEKTIAELAAEMEAMPLLSFNLPRP